MPMQKYLDFFSMSYAMPQALHPFPCPNIFLKGVRKKEEGLVCIVSHLATHRPQNNFPGNDTKSVYLYSWLPGIHKIERHITCNNFFFKKNPNLKYFFFLQEAARLQRESPTSPLVSASSTSVNRLGGASGQSVSPVVGLASSSANSSPLAAARWRHNQHLQRSPVNGRHG